jgi:hypothetical protein
VQFALVGTIYKAVLLRPHANQRRESKTCEKRNGPEKED